MIHNESQIEQLMHSVKNYFEEKHSLNLFKKTRSLRQLLQQGEIDVVGTELESGSVKTLYAVDVAFHESGLNYGSKEETLARVIKKMTRTILTLLAFFDLKSGEVIFASPKVASNIEMPLRQYMQELQDLMMQNGLNFQVTLVCNEEFGEEIYRKVLARSDSVADTSELFMRAVQMANLFAATLPDPNGFSPNNKDEFRKNIEGVEADESKIGAFVRDSFRKIISEKRLAAEEVERLQDLTYSKLTFKVNLPILKVFDEEVLGDDQYKVNGRGRYYKETYWIHGKPYLLCNHWVEKHSRKPFITWLESLAYSENVEERHV